MLYKRKVTVKIERQLLMKLKYKGTPAPMNSKSCTSQKNDSFLRYMDLLLLGQILEPGISGPTSQD